MKKFLITLWAPLIVLLSCNENTVEKILKIKLKFPDSLVLLDDYQKNAFYNKNSYKVKNLQFLCIINVGCEVCINHINTWGGFIDSLRSIHIPTTIIFITDDTSYLRRHIIPEIKIEALFLADTKNKFYKINKELYSIPEIDANFLLLDQSDVIQVYGNPFNHKNTKNMYWYVIDKFVEAKKLAKEL